VCRYGMCQEPPITGKRGERCATGAAMEAEHRREREAHGGVCSPGCPICLYDTPPATTTTTTKETR
jgi:hypothetical protein